MIRGNQQKNAKRSYYHLRQDLKRSIFRTRGVLVIKPMLMGYDLSFYNQHGYPRQGMLPLCAICNKHLSPNGGEMHEAIITRGEAMGTKAKSAIMVKENCVILHPGCHRKAHNQRNRIKCTQYLVNWCGKEAVNAWLITIEEEYELVNELRQAKRMVAATTQHFV